MSAVIKPDHSRVGFDYWPDGQISAKGGLPPVAALHETRDTQHADDLFGIKAALAEKRATENNALTVASAGDKFKETEAMLWDGLALLEKQSCGVSREACPGDAQSVAYTVEPHISGGVPLLAQSSPVERPASSAPAMLVSDFLGTTLGTVQGELRAGSVPALPA